MARCKELSANNPIRTRSIAQCRDASPTASLRLGFLYMKATSADGCVSETVVRELIKSTTQAQLLRLPFDLKRLERSGAMERLELFERLDTE